jgi:hypothetical protein
VHSRELDRIAPLSDVHGNRTALEAVLADIDARGITGIYNLGDYAGKGHRGREVIDVCHRREALSSSRARRGWGPAQLADTPATGAGPVPDVVGYADTHDPCYGYADGTYDLDTCSRVPRS